jgi:hypothetical protein
MLNKSISKRLNSLLDCDPDDVPRLAASISPNQQQDAVTFFLSIALDKDIESAMRLNGLRYANVLLSNQSPVISTDAAVSLLTEVLRALKRLRAKWIFEPLLLVSNYLLEGEVLQLRPLRSCTGFRFKVCRLTPDFGLVHAVQHSPVSLIPDAAEAQHPQLQDALGTRLLPTHAA